ncbi:hypothetical protein WJX74_010424 [Apatococcus lobatus]|uniref:histidine kinase n=1 Tax=Apatococcus lobatus TaxID=904363 RepID=A0AAW1RTA8_9CHLO
MRFAHWAATTALIVYLVSRLTDFTARRTTTVCLAQAGVILFGFLGFLSPPAYQWYFFPCAFALFSYVIFSLWCMASSALKIRDLGGELFQLPSNRLKAFLITAIGSWILFPGTIFAGRAGLLDAATTEIILVYANFAAKALLSSGAMYGGFMTLQKRREIAAMAKEHDARVHLVRTLQDTVREKDELMSVVSHELRAPLNSVIGLSEAMIAGNCGQLSEKVQSFVSTIHNSSCLLVNMINDILDMASFKHGKLTIRHEKVNVGTIIKQVLDTMGYMAKEGVHLVKRAGTEATPEIIGDSGRITQILVNLVANALKFTEKGTVTVGAEQCLELDHICLTVKDTGIGIPADKHVKIFQAFEQADMSTTRKFGGTGLGLHITKVLVEAHEGTIRVVSEPGTGATFIVTLPINQAGDGRHHSLPKVAAGTFSLKRFSSMKPMPSSLKVLYEEDDQEAENNAAEQIPAHGLGPSGDTTASDTKVRTDYAVGFSSDDVKHSSAPVPDGWPAAVNADPEGAPEVRLSHTALGRPTHGQHYGNRLALIIDDDEVARLVVQQCVEPLGYKMAAFGDPVAALTWVEQQQFLPDIVFLDYMMPSMSGITFCIKLREMVPRSIVPVIMISAKTDEDSIVQSLSAGCNDFISKPVRREELTARIDIHTAAKDDGSWVKGLVTGSTNQDTEAMQLLQAILPEKIINKIQNGQKFIAETHKHVIVLFSDIVGFTTLSSTMPTSEIFMMLSNMFSAFDRLVDRFGIYKVETIGDSYMAVVGHDEDASKLKFGRPVDRMLQMASAMLDVVNDLTMLDGSKVKIRIGIHSGSAFAGVISMKCPRYCFVGDSVNTASRMESNGFPMTVHVSEAFVNDMRDPSMFVPCGARLIKGKGDMMTYLAKLGQWEKGLESVKSIGETSITVLHASSEAPPSIPHGAQRDEEKLANEVVRLASELQVAKLELAGQKGENAELQGLVGSLEAQLKLAQAHLAEEQASRGCAQLALTQQEMQLKTAMDSFRMKDSLCNQLQQQLQLLSDDQHQQAGKRVPHAQRSHAYPGPHAGRNHSAAVAISEDDEEEAIHEHISAEPSHARPKDAGHKQRHAGHRHADGKKGRRHSARHAPLLALQAARPAQNDDDDEEAASDLEMASSGVTVCVRGLGSRGAKLKLDLTG